MPHTCTAYTRYESSCSTVGLSIGLVRTELDFCLFVLFCFVLFCFVWFCLVWFGLVWFGLVWFGFGLVWFGLVWFCFVLIFCFLPLTLVTKEF